MSDTPEQEIQADDAQVQADGPDDNAELLNKVQLLEANNRKLLGEKKNALSSMEDLQRKVQDLQNNQQQAKQTKLAEAGEFKTLWNEATATVSSLQDEIAGLKQQLEDKEVQFQGQQIKATALNAFSQGGVHAPEDLFNLEKDNLRLKDGSVVALVGGVEVPLQKHVESMKSPGSGRDYFFSGSGARGMSAAGSTTTTAGGQSWANMTPFERMTVEAMDEQNGTNNAARLKAAG